LRGIRCTITDALPSKAAAADRLFGARAGRAQSKAVRSPAIHTRFIASLTSGMPLVGARRLLILELGDGSALMEPGFWHRLRTVAVHP
jgi:hypothetical protein